MKKWWEKNYPELGDKILEKIVDKLLDELVDFVFDFIKFIIYLYIIYLLSNFH